MLFVLDGLGGLPDPETGKTELESAKTPNLDRLATEGICGLADPISPGITPGSGPGHLALFGYDPVICNIGRGILEAVGIDFDLKPGDVASRGNFCTLDENGIITDRRAGRISTEKNRELCRMLDGMEIEGVKILVTTVKDHRLVVVFRGDGLAPEVTDSDPGQTGVPPRTLESHSTGAAKLAGVAGKFLEMAKKTLSDQHPANMILLRGFSRRPQLPSIGGVYKLNPAAIASYPMYRGLAKLAGMRALQTGTTIADEFATLKNSYDKYDFFFLHVKGVDSAGEDGDFTRKIDIIEQVDQILPVLTGLAPDVIVVTGDHSTPARLKAHSWHPVPVLLHSEYCRRDGVNQFSEAACRSGGLGRIPMVNLMTLMMANALKLDKFGA